jgi:hypothetical protein
MPTRLSNLLAAGAVALAIGAAPIQTRAAGCGELPELEWLWGGLSHDRIKAYVARKHDGDWEPYVRKWENQQAKLQRIHAKGSAVVFRKKGVTLKGQTLADYIEKVGQRIEVARCLAAAEGFDNFDTAAGSADD